MNYTGFARTPGDVPYFSVPPVTYANPPKEEVRVHRLFVDSRDRHDPASSSHYDFRVFMGADPRSVGISGYENVTAVELKAVAFPKVAGERYVVVSIAELNDDMLDATNSGAHNSFAVVYFDSDSLAAGVVKPLKGADFYLKQLTFKPSLPKLNTLTVRFLKPDGSVVTAADTGGQETPVSMLLEITTKSTRMY